MKDRIKYIVIDLLIIGFILGGLFLVNKGYIQGDKVLDYNNINAVYKSEMQKLIEDNFSFIQTDNKKQIVKEFDLNKSIFSFRNLSTLNNDGGNCLGMSVFIKGIYENSLPKKLESNNISIYDISNIKSDIYSYKFSQNMINYFYGLEDTEEDFEIPTEEDYLKRKYAYDIIAKNYDKPIELSLSDKKEKLDIDYIYKKAFNKIEVVDKNNSINFSEEDKDMLEIIKAINYYQINYKSLGYKEDDIIPSTYSTKLNATFSVLSTLSPRFLYGYKNHTTLDFEREILTPLNNNKLLIFGFRPLQKVGHAILGYGYEKINDDAYKVYIYDSNYPFTSDVFKDSDKINEDIENNMYILFEKIDGKWQYIYAPYINGNYLYDGSYNSLTPNMMLNIWS